MKLIIGLVISYQLSYRNFDGLLTQALIYTINSARSRKEYLVLTCGPPSISTTVPKGKDGDCESCSDDDVAEDDENQTVCFLAAYSHNMIFL